MLVVGVRELRARASELLRRVRENAEEVQVTYRGRVVARLIPARPPVAAGPDVAAVCMDLDRLAAEIGRHWPPEVTAAEAVSEGRRAL